MNPNYPNYPYDPRQYPQVPPHQVPGANVSFSLFRSFSTNLTLYLSTHRILLIQFNMVIHMGTHPMFLQHTPLILHLQVIMASILSTFIQLRLTNSKSLLPLRKHLKLGWRNGYRLKMKEV
jgi:hypothetical protein